MPKPSSLQPLSASLVIHHWTILRHRHHTPALRNHKCVLIYRSICCCKLFQYLTNLFWFCIFKWRRKDKLVCPFLFFFWILIYISFWISQVRDFICWLPRDHPPSLIAYMFLCLQVIGWRFHLHHWIYDYRHIIGFSVLFFSLSDLTDEKQHDLYVLIG